MPNVTNQSDHAAVPQRATIPGIQNPLGFVTGTLSSASATLLSAIGIGIPAGAVFAQIQAAGGAINWRDDGTNPTTVTGMTIPNSGELLYNGQLAKLALIAQGANTTINIAYYG